MRHVCAYHISDFAMTQWPVICTVLEWHKGGGHECVEGLRSGKAVDVHLVLREILK